MLNFIQKEPSINIGDAQLTFYRQGFTLNKVGSSPSYIDVILSGVSPLTLEKAISLNYLKLFGGTEQLPETYLDTVTLSGGCEQRNLPVGYTQVNGVTNTNYQYINLDTTLTQDDEIELVFSYSTNDIIQQQIFGSRINASASNISIFFGSTSNRLVVDFNNSDYTNYRLSADVTPNTIYKVLISKNRRAVYQGSTLVAENTTVCNDTINITNPLLCYLNGTPAYSNKFDGTIYSLKINGKRHLTSCTQSTNTGFYDSISNAMFTLEGGTAGADITPTPDTVMDIICNNGVLKINNNLFNSSTSVTDKFINDTGEIRDNEGSFYSALIPVKPNTEYTFYRDTGTGSYPRMHAYDSNGDWLAMIAKGEDTQTSLVISGTTTATTAFIRVTGKQAIDTRVYLTDYTYNAIYADGTQEVVTDNVGNTANAEILLAVGDYKDTQEVLSGAVTRNIGIKVFDGTEEYTYSVQNTYGIANITSTITGKVDGNDNLLMCSHFAPQITPWAQTTTEGILNGNSNNQVFFRVLGTRIPDVASWKQYLAQQYAQGTPIIIVYPKSSATTESVAGQFLSKSPVTQTAGSINNLPVAITESEKTVPTPQQPLDINCNNGVLKYGNISKNLFDSSAFNTDVGESITWLHYQIPNGTYTMSTNFPPQEGQMYTNVWILAGNVTSGQDSTRNGVSLGNPKTITVTDGWYTIAYRSTTPNIPRNPKDYNWQVEQGNTATPYQPYVEGIYTDGTTETVEVTGKNLFDVSAATEGYYIAANGTVTPTTSDGIISDYIPVSSSTGYILSCLVAISQNTIRVHNYDSSKTWISQATYGTTGNVGTTYTNTFTTASNAKYVRISISKQTNVQVELGSTATTYEPYFNGGSATAEMLLKVGTHKDVQSVLDGGVSRNVGVLVLDGTETWKKSGTYIGSFYSNTISPTLPKQAENPNVLCSHGFKVNDLGEYANASIGACYWYSPMTLNYKYDDGTATVEQFEQYLANQYNAGTPVILVYPLATATTETVTAQTLTLQNGTNIVEITQASMDNLTMEVSFKQQA